MSISKILFLAAAVLLLIGAVGVTFIPNPMMWALFCLAVGFFLSGYDLKFKKE